jgi:hypothetical protein
MTTTIEFITALFCQVDDHLAGLPNHPEAHLWPSAVVTLGLGCRTFLSCISKGFGSFCSRLLRLRTGKLSSAFRLHGFTHIF